MKKWNKIIAFVLAALIIAVMLPMGNVQALKRKPVMRPELETEQETSEEEAETPKEEPEDVESESETPKEEETSEQIVEAASSIETTLDPIESTEDFQNDKITAKIKDTIELKLDYENGNYVRRAVHTITLTKGRNAARDIYENISYGIYQKTNQGEISLKESSLQIPNKNADSFADKIEASYTQTGDYCIRVWKIWSEDSGDTVEELLCHDFSIAKLPQNLILSESVANINYGDVIYLDNFIDSNFDRNIYLNEDNSDIRQKEYELWEDSGKHNKILEIGQEGERIYIKAIGINDADAGFTSVRIKKKGTALLETSNEVMLKITVNPMELNIEAQTDASSIYLYDTLTVTVTVQRDGQDVMQELFNADKNLRVNITITSNNHSYTISTREAVNHIPVRSEYFKDFYKGAEYDITVTIQYEEETEYFPYKVNTVVKKVELLGRCAVIKLSAEQDGIYDYHTCYGGTMPILQVELEDVTETPDAPHQTDETGQKVAPEEAAQIKYHITSTDEKVVSTDSAEQYTAADNSIPISIKGIGKATLTVTADASNVYTVKSSKIDITVKNSPLYDEDFVISVSDADGMKEQMFCGDKSQPGFEKWQEYLKTHNSWVNGNVRISFTELGSKFYSAFNYTEDNCFIENVHEICLDSDRNIVQYTFSASNPATSADTKYSGDEKGVRTFEMGIDTTPPKIKSFHAPTNYYAPTRTEEQQYFSQSFVLTGDFTDATSGIAAIEYTADVNAKNGAKWTALEKAEEAENEKNFKLELGDGIYPAIAVRAIDAAGNISEPICLKNEKGAFIKIIVDSTPPKIDVAMTSKEEDNIWCEYSAEDENWTNKEIRFQISEQGKDKAYSGVYRVEYAFQNIVEKLSGKPIEDTQWQTLVTDAHGIAKLSVGGEDKNPINKNGYYYFRGVSPSGVKSASITEKRILLWQKMADIKPIVESGVDFEKRWNEWYNKESGTPIIDFVYPEYDTGVISGAYAAPITIHYNLNVKDEKNVTTSLADNKTATIRADFSQKISQANISSTGFPLQYDELSQLQAKLTDDGIYTLEYWITDAAGNESETEINTYQIDCHEPTALKIFLDDAEQVIGNETSLVYENFYQNSVSGKTSAEYGISGKDSIKLLKAKRIGEWKEMVLTEDAEQFQIEPCIRCLLYIRAVDGAGNVAEGWTKGIVVDNEIPTGEGVPQLIVEPDGANKHGFFNKDVKVKINIQDAPNDGNSAGLKLVTASFGTEEKNTISDKELFSSMEGQVSESLMRETENFSIVETIDAKMNEGNHAYITVNATDRSENMSTDTQELKIDVTKPEIEITFDNENAVNGRYYNADRRAKINIKEHNFDASLVKLKATRDGKDFSLSVSDWESDNDNHYAYVDFTADGDYTFSVECMDLADNEADKESAEPFTIDKIPPKVEIALESGNVQKEYFNQKQTAVITVTEHNFNADDVHIQMQPAGKVGSWDHKNDTHVIKVDFLSEGECALSCDCSDLAGNGISDEDSAKMPLEFVIDMTNPVIEISGVEDNSANAGAVTPNITVRDAYAEPTNVTITLTTGRGAAAEISSDITTALTDGGFLYTLNGLDTKPDDIYYLTVSAADKAGNVSELTTRFSLNRRGSAYDLTDLAKFKECYYNSYNNFKDIKIVEMNVDKVEEFALYLSHNANIIYGKSGSRVLALDESKLHEAVLYNVDVSGSEDTGYVYTYTIYRENFAREGIYRLGIYSKDAAGNEVNNLLEQNGEEIQFVIDNTTPRVVIDGVENNKIYDASSQEVRVVVEDNFKLSEAQLTLVNQDGTVLESWDYFDLVENEGDTAKITIGEHSEEVSLLYSAVDAAGNEMRTLQGEKDAKSDFLVTTDKFVQLVNKPAQTTVGRGIAIVPMLLLAGTGIVLVMLAFAILKISVLKKTAKKRK